MCGAEDTTEILGEKLAQLVGCYCRDRLHRPPPRQEDVIIWQANGKAKDASAGAARIRCGRRPRPIATAAHTSGLRRDIVSLFNGAPPLAGGAHGHHHQTARSDYASWWRGNVAARGA